MRRNSGLLTDIVYLSRTTAIMIAILAPDARQLRKLPPPLIRPATNFAVLINQDLQNRAFVCKVTIMSDTTIPDESKELSLVNKVELRIALADTETKLQNLLKLYLAPLLLKLGSPHASVRNKARAHYMINFSCV